MEIISSANPKNKFIINDDARPFTNDEVCMFCKGMSFNELVADIKRNIDGKYDHLYT